MSSARSCCRNRAGGEERKLKYLWGTLLVAAAIFIILGVLYLM
jgi:hypothetical protein